MSRTGIDLFTPEGDPHAIPCWRRAVPHTSGRNHRVLLSVLRLFFNFLLLLLLIVYVNSSKLWFFTSSFAAVTVAAFTMDVSRLNSEIYELHRPARHHFRRIITDYAPECARAYMRACMFVRTLDRWMSWSAAVHRLTDWLTDKIYRACGTGLVAESAKSFHGYAFQEH